MSRLRRSLPRLRALGRVRSSGLQMFLQRGRSVRLRFVAGPWLYLSSHCPVIYSVRATNFSNARTSGAPAIRHYEGHTVNINVCEDRTSRTSMEGETYDTPPRTSSQRPAVEYRRRCPGVVSVRTIRAHVRSVLLSFHTRSLSLLRALGRVRSFGLRKMFLQRGRSGRLRFRTGQWLYLNSHWPVIYTQRAIGPSTGEGARR